MERLTGPKLGLVSAVFVLGLMAGCGKQSSDEYIQEAKQYLAEDNSAAAIVALKNAVKTAPKSAQARYELGRVYVIQKQYESAEKELNRALEYGFEASKVLPLLTQAYQNTGAYSALSKIEHEQAGLTSVEKAEIGYFKVVSLARLDNVTEAKLLIEDLRSLDTRSVYKGLTAAYSLVLDSDFENALVAVSALKDESPQNAEVLKLLAQLHLASNQPKEAADVFKDYVQFYPEDSQTTFVLAKLLVDIGEMSAAEPYVDSLLKINKQHGLLNQLKAAISTSKENYSDALKHAEIAISNGVDELSLRLIAGYAAYQEQDFTGANRHLSYIAGALPNNHPGLKLLAASQLQLGLTTDLGGVLSRLDKLTEQDAPLFSKASYELIKGGYEKDAEILIEKTGGISRTAEDLTRLGLLQLSLDNLDGIVNLEQAVAKAPELDSAQLTLAKAYIVTAQYDKALDLANSWKQTAVDDARPYLLAGDVYVKLENFKAAKSEFSKAKELSNGGAIPKLALINLELLQGNLDLANDMLDAVLQEYPTDVTALATFYLISKQQGNQAAGLEKIKSTFDKNQTNIGLRLLLARVWLVEQRYSEVITLLDELGEKESLPKEYWATLGRSLIRDNQRQGATQHYDRWLAFAPNDKDAVIGKLFLLDSQNKFAEGAKLTQSFLVNRDDVQMQILDTHFLLMKSDFEAAQKSYDKLPAEVLEEPMSKGFLARFQLSRNELEPALVNAEIAYDATQNSRNLLLVIHILDLLEHADKSLLFLEEHLEEKPNDLVARMLFAERQIGGDIGAAMVTYKKALEQNPNNYIANNNLAYLYLKQGEIDIAKQFAEKAAELNPDSVETLDTLAQIYVADQDYEEALELYSRVVTDDLKNEEIYLNYVETLLVSGDAFLAKRKIEQREMKLQESLDRVQALITEYGIE
ncbi:XrtA/PEP-CTERM system TPR-repeat protein PrsT [uncultured Paraglaciecola sp.]|uniref:XrtA/PEP-CTERM system TPR-repeat protein PrsT n=1 Tax=uncultured Paraglaciecola sp. TaxID=1765024 RepID=UPI002595D141|nr:XrtA/PEP-CTERM system TPR-repeat protein PrsT [uncultured Paraglaciecola sp.]